MPVVAIAFTPATADQNPNQRRPTALVGEAYYRSMVVTFASVRRCNPEVTLALISDVAVPEPYRSWLRCLSVQHLEQPFDHRPPHGFWPQFNASLYTLDALECLSRCEPSATILIDPDVLCRGSLQPIVARLTGGRFGVYETGFPDDESSNGLTATEAMGLHRELRPELTEVPTHYGGEIYAFQSDELGPLLHETRRAWVYTLEKFDAGNKHFVTEEHILNYALRGRQLSTLNEFIRRIWTAPTNRIVERGDEGLVLWHLPAEKDRAFRRLLKPATSAGSWWWSSDLIEFRRRLGLEVGIPRRAPKRLAFDLGGRSIRTVQRTIGRSRGRDHVSKRALHTEGV